MNLMLMTRKSRRTAKVLHLKNQNVIGASVVKNFMESNSCFKAGIPWEDAEATIAAEKDWCPKIQILHVEKHGHV